MFGTRDSHRDGNDQGAPAVPAVGHIPSGNGIPDDHAVSQMLTDSTPGVTAPMQAPAQPPANPFMPFSGSPFDTPQQPAQMSQHAGAPMQMPNPFGAPTAPAQPMQQPAPQFSAPPAPQFSAPPAPSHAELTTVLETNGDELLTMKQEALSHLQPLVGTLQQHPEDEFRTLMMMIQATDDKSLLKKALDAAKKIGDDKIRAQAMLDVINEINYFTQTAND